MTGTPAGKQQANEQIRCGKDLLLSCLSRLIVEGQRVESRSGVTAKNGHTGLGYHQPRHYPGNAFASWSR